MESESVLREAAPTELRSGPSFGGVVPSSCVARDGGTMVAALCVEHHADGAVVPLLVLSDAPGVLSWESLEDVVVRDDHDRGYAVSVLHGQAGLGAMQVSLLVEPAPPADARHLLVMIPSLSRLAPARGGSGVTRPLAGGPWVLDVDLVPSRTTVPVPARVDPVDLDDDEPLGAGRVPTRGVGAFVDLVPVGQARVGAHVAVSLCSLERYEDLAVLTLAILDDPAAESPHAAEDVAVAAWDDRGTSYDVEFESASGAPGWSELAVRLTPALHPEATRLGVRVAPEPGAEDGPDFLFGVALPFPPP